MPFGRRNLALARQVEQSHKNAPLASVLPVLPDRGTPTIAISSAVTVANTPDAEIRDAQHAIWTFGV